MRVFINLQALVTNDDDQRQKLLDQAITFDDTDATTASTFQSAIMKLDPLDASVPFDFGDVDVASTLIVVASDEIQLQLDSNTAPLVTVRPIPAFAAASILSRFQREEQPGLVVWRGKISSLFVSNPSTLDSASVYIAVVGDALP
jgi:hypothetical protein